MTTTFIDKEFGKYWSQLNKQQKKSILKLIKAFFQQKEETSLEKYILNFSGDKKQGMQIMDIRQYNKGIDEIMKRVTNK